MRYAKIRSMDISNGEGIRVSLFVQGCNFRCKGCFNQDTWNFDDGKEWNKEIEDKFIELCKQPHIQGVSILGGEPLQQDNDMLHLLQRIKREVNKKISVWTGYKIEDIPEDKKVLLEYIDEIIDGQFIESQKDPKLDFRGSSNQKRYRKAVDY